MIDSTLEPGHLTYGELSIEGEGDGEVLVSTYVCHPSLANDNLSGIVVATMLAKELMERRLRHSYRFLFAPGTIGPLAWLHENRDSLSNVEHGLTLSCIGDDGSLTYKRSRRGDAEVDRAMETVLRDSGAPHRVLPWEPWGGDERQFCSPGFDLPVGSLMRTPHGEFDGYHTSADGLERIRPESLAEAVDTCLDLVEVLESNRRMTNLSPFGEPQLGRRGLYRSAGGAVATPDDERALLWVLNQSDGALQPARHRARLGAALPGHPARRRTARARGLLTSNRPQAEARSRECPSRGRRGGAGGHDQQLGAGRPHVRRDRREQRHREGDRDRAGGGRRDGVRGCPAKARARGDSQPSKRCRTVRTVRGRPGRRRADQWARQRPSGRVREVWTFSFTAPERSRWASSKPPPSMTSTGSTPPTSAPRISSRKRCFRRCAHERGRSSSSTRPPAWIARANVAQYAATKHALKALADSLREEVNPQGIRVIERLPGSDGYATPG